VCIQHAHTRIHTLDSTPIHEQKRGEDGKFYDMAKEPTLPRNGKLVFNIHNGILIKSNLSISGWVPISISFKMIKFNLLPTMMMVMFQVRANVLLDSFSPGEVG
jgi:hypothetical protein